MSIGLSIEVGAQPGDGFTVKRLAGCRLVFGQVPLSDFPMLQYGFSNKALMDAQVADRIGATVVIGEPDDLVRLREMDLPVSEVRMIDSRRAEAQGKPRIARWLHDGDRGLSSNAICKANIGVPDSAGTDHPRCPDDLGRCLEFLRTAGDEASIEVAAALSPAWKRLVAHWADLEVLYDSEETQGEGFRQTRALMESLLEE